MAFFPAFPLLARAVAAVSGLRAETALLIVAHLLLAGSFVLAAAYVRRRFAQSDEELADFVLLALGLFPTTFYFRMAYSESTFLFLCLLALLGMESPAATGVGKPGADARSQAMTDWRFWWAMPTLRAVWVALVVGAATATRPVGVALLTPLAIYLGERSDSWRAFVVRCMVLLPLACWGLVAYIAYQAWAFGEPLAFVKTQIHWSHTMHHDFWWERALRLATLEPIRAVYDPSSSCYWGQRPPRDSAVFNMMFANPIYFLFTAATVAFGGWKGWLTKKELALSAGLLLIPYILQADRTCMASQARFASVVFPAYLVWGQVLYRLPGSLAAALLAICGFMLAAYSALFVSWYWFY